MQPRWWTARFGSGWTLRRHGGGGWADTWQARRREDRLFVKTVPAARADVLDAEADGLRALAEAVVASRTAMHLPRVVDRWDGDGVAALAMPALDLASSADAGFGVRLGDSLAALHQATPPGNGRFGWHRDNWLGGTPQRNGWSAAGGVAGWATFVGEHRLRAFAAGLPTPLPALAARVADALPGLFDDGHVPRPSLIHGDLWSGNWGMLADGRPTIFDPAVHVADAEAELAMMELFGSPPAGFWPAYRDAAGLSPGYPRRRRVYQLVHLLNHARLFGGGYFGQAEAVAQQVLRTR